MKYNLYDFDNTIYEGDSSIDFVLFCFKKKYVSISHILKIIVKFIQYKTKYLNRTEFFEFVYSYFKNIDDMDNLVHEFWEKHRSKIKSFYLNKDHSKDIIISASHTFRLKPICDELGVKDLIASEVDPKTGKYLKPHCHGQEKVKALYEKYPKIKIMTMYSDSIVDKPLLDLAEKSYYVKKNEIYDYHHYKPNFFIRFWRWGWGVYHKKEEIWNYLIVGGLTTLISIYSYILFLNLNFHYQIANILSWILAVTFAYFTNRWFVFHSRNKDKLKEAISFYSSRIITLLLETGILFILIDLIDFNAKTSKIFAQIVILIANYVISKLIVFKKVK